MTVVGIFLWKQLHEFLLNPQSYRLYDFAIDVARKLVNIEIKDGSQIEKKIVGLALHNEVFREKLQRA